MWSLLPYAKKYQKELILGPLFKLFEAILELILPLYMAQLLDQAISEKNSQLVWLLAGKMLLISCLGLFFVILCQYYASIASQGFGTELRNQLTRKINRLSYAQLDQSNENSLITRITNDTNQLQLALAMLIRLVIRAPFLCIGSIIMAYRIEPKVTLLFIAVLPIFIAAIYMISKITMPFFKKGQQLLDQLTHLVAENLSGIRVIRAFSKTPQQITRFDETSDDLANTSIKAANIAAILGPVTTFVINGAILFILYFSSFSINAGTLKQGEVIALINYMTQMLMALIVISNLVVIFSRAEVSAKRISEILDLPEETIADEKRMTQKIETIRFDNVAFQYPNTKKKTLAHLNFTIQEGEWLGITGPTGSGKSTLIPLLTNLYPVSDGQILFNNESSAYYSSHELLSKIAIVPQKNILFSGTLRENLQMMAPDASDEEIWNALDIAQCRSFVEELPDQLDALVQASGKNFSGGQRQRLTIARALVQPKEIIIFDDSFSALDYQTDFNLRQALRNKLQQATIIMISQRLSTIAEAEQILVLEQGKILAHGTHQTLLKESAFYLELAKMQGLEGGFDYEK
ncbi:ABC transporter ATP-binding protein [Vagococcus silagei]|uniref:ABC transporter ATP-binding protein n=1 Tax=Vagococcus silagei TaxID=2508885 RepID=A0A4S3B4J4_9ENTE|nr:ABC transporter ATP-binding protein [Vagococcus silagei]THB61772.1 ABC transporter ATP-binding protein [Vagococcus silagei]